jgi:hypothetical protein
MMRDMHGAAARAGAARWHESIGRIDISLHRYRAALPGRSTARTSDGADSNR